MSSNVASEEVKSGDFWLYWKPHDAVCSRIWLIFGVVGSPCHGLQQLPQHGDALPRHPLEVKRDGEREKQRRRPVNKN